MTDKYVIYTTVWKNFIQFSGKSWSFAIILKPKPKLCTSQANHPDSNQILALESNEAPNQFNSKHIFAAMSVKYSSSRCTSAKMYRIFFFFFLDALDSFKTLYFLIWRQKSPILKAKKRRIRGLKESVKYSTKLLPHYYGYIKSYFIFPICFFAKRSVYDHSTAVIKSDKNNILEWRKSSKHLILPVASQKVFCNMCRQDVLQQNPVEVFHSFNLLTLLLELVFPEEV